MKLVKTPYDHLSGISRFDLQFIQSDPVFEKYHSYTSDIEGIRQAILNKSSNYNYRQELVKILSKQHLNCKQASILESIQKLGSDNCYCVTSAHQPCLFGGPAYFIYKIASTIHLARKLSLEFPEDKFVPVFFLGSEDHDFEEMNHLNLFNKKISWENPDVAGASGRWNTAGMQEVKQSILDLFENQPEKVKFLDDLLDLSSHQERYGLVMRNFIYRLFGEYGLVILDPDDAEFKKLMIPVFRDELFNRNSEKIIRRTIEQLESDKIKVQARGRDINLFYLMDQFRERIVFENGLYKVLNTDITFDAETIERELEDHPERFSPNVILRPLYQETLLPNIAFVGGGGEIAYWTELKHVFEHYGVNFPPLIRRNSVTMIDAGLSKRLSKAGLEVKELQFPFEKIEKDFLTANAEVLDFKEIEKNILMEFEKIQAFAANIDPGSTGRLHADKSLISVKVNDWEKKLNKQIKLKHETKLNQIRSTYEKIFPNMNLQERYESCVWLLVGFGEEIIPFLIENLNPLDKEFIFIVQS